MLRLPPKDNQVDTWRRGDRTLSLLLWGSWMVEKTPSATARRWLRPLPPAGSMTSRK